MLLFKKIMYWLLPILILSYVFSKINFTQFINILNTSDPVYIILGVLTIQLTVSIGALRWFVLLERKISFVYVIKHYWIGLSMGIFMPASIGWDAYRVTIVGKIFGKYIKQISILIWEKLIALLNALFIVMLLFPFLSLSYYQDVLDNIYYLALISSIAIILIIIVFRKKYLNKIFFLFLERVKMIFRGIINKIYAYLPNEKNELLSIFMQTINTKFIVYAFSFSFFIQVSSAISAQFFFIALNYEISFWINLFVTPILFFIFLMPVSFGGLGVREASYVGVYHLFGVPIEIALIVSFLGLFAVLINIAIGGVVIWINKKELP